MTYIGASAPRVHLLLPVCLLGLCALLPAHTSADIYKWVDDEGRVNYTQSPPPPGIASETIRQAPEPRVTPGRPSAITQQERVEENKKEQEENAVQAEQKTQIEDIRRLNCDAATGNLAALELGGSRRYVTADGEYLRLTEEERQQRIEEAKQQIEKYCTE